MDNNMDAGAVADAGIIFKYFPELTDTQCHRFEMMGPLYH